jgi:acyl-[acyl-carrier-protein]-phospholipid O-acyltransferase/long-chain-fatty-acid--[acyl-carrier-protein] ligase
MNILKNSIRWIVTRLYKVNVKGMEHYPATEERVIVVANHTSFLDAILLYAFLPVKLTFAVNTFISQGWYLKILSRLVHLFPMDPTNPLSIRALIKKVESGGHVVIFPEGRITVTGSLMKVYQGPGLVAEKTNALVVPVCIEGAQYTPFSRLKGRVRRRWFPEVTLTIMPSRQLEVDDQLTSREKREKAGKLLSKIMTETVFHASPRETTLTQRLLDAAHVHGGSKVVMEDINRRPLTFQQFITKSVVLGKALSRFTEQGEHVGVLLPGSMATVVAFFGLQHYRRTPAMLNFTVGSQGMISACETAQVKTVVTSRAFIEKGKLEDVIEKLSSKVTVCYLEDIAKKISLPDKLIGLVQSRSEFLLKRLPWRKTQSADPSVVLFTSGSEGTPKGVVLSHANLLSNIQQLASRIDFSATDIALTALPMFHSFGLTGGTLMPLLAGMKTFYYPSPLHYRIVPELAYDIGATIMFGTNTFLAGYAKAAHPYDFYSIRYVFAGAEKLRDEVRRVWEDKFGVRIFEGYGATETSPALSANDPMGNRPGTVGRLLPGIEYHLEQIPNLNEGARLHVRGPNIMLGYLLHDNPGVLVPPSSSQGDGWYDTGDIVEIDEDDFVTICGRAKRFAKIAGEMVSLTSVESLASKVWPDALHAAVSIPDERKGEQIILLTDQSDAQRSSLMTQAKQDGVGEICVPRTVMSVNSIPVLGTGKVDYTSAQKLVEDVA